MKKVLVTIGLSLCCAIVAYAQDAVLPPQITETDWCTIEVPATAKIDQMVPVKFTLKKIDPGMKLAADLHGKTTVGKYIGMVKWGGAPKAAVSDQTVMFEIKVLAKPDLGSVHVSSYLSPTGEFKDRVKDAQSAEIKIVQ